MKALETWLVSAAQNSGGTAKVVGPQLEVSAGSLFRSRRRTRYPTNPMLCENEHTSTVRNNGRTTGGVTGKGFMPGQSGNPRGRPKGLAKATRALVGEDGMALVELWWQIAQDPMQRTRDRLEASRLLADRGWGKAPAYMPIEEDNPLGLEDVEAAAEEFRRMILRLAPDQD
jgi:Family of unknown function (DUF5681)